MLKHYNKDDVRKAYDEDTLLRTMMPEGYENFKFSTMEDKSRSVYDRLFRAETSVFADLASVWVLGDRSLKEIRDDFYIDAPEHKKIIDRLVKMKLALTAFVIDRAFYMDYLIYPTDNRMMEDKKESISYLEEMFFRGIESSSKEQNLDKYKNVYKVCVLAFINYIREYGLFSDKISNVEFSYVMRTITDVYLSVVGLDYRVRLYNDIPSKVVMKTVSSKQFKELTEGKYNEVVLMEKDLILFDIECSKCLTQYEFPISSMEFECYSVNKSTHTDLLGNSELFDNLLRNNLCTDCAGK